MLLNILNFFNLHYYDAFLNLEAENKRLQKCNRRLRQKKNITKKNSTQFILQVLL